jgi:hypothetical protein
MGGNTMFDAVERQIRARVSTTTDGRLERTLILICPEPRRLRY